MFNIKTYNNILIKNKNNTKQSLLSREDRSKNVYGVYKIQDNEKIYKKNILLLDDIYTTGATVNECCKMLKFAGAKQVDVFTIAKD